MYATKKIKLLIDNKVHFVTTARIKGVHSSMHVTFLPSFKELIMREDTTKIIVLLKACNEYIMMCFISVFEDFLTRYTYGPVNIYWGFGTGAF